MGKPQPQPFHQRLAREFGWQVIGRVPYALLTFVVVSQAVTVAITWPLWELRDTPVHLPTLPLPQIPFGGLMIVSLVLVAFFPRPGVIVHCATLLLACVFDQFRSQPQFAAHCALMIACVSEPGLRWVRWVLAAMWLWTGIHKFVSPEWWGHASFWLLSRSQLDPNPIQLPFVIIIALTEITLGLLAIFAPRWAAYLCAALHLGIALFLTPLGVNWNTSVIPWNLSMALVGSWVMWRAAQPQKIGTWEKRFAVICMIWPFGFYLSWVDHGYSHVLYSSWLPRAVISQPDGAYEIYGWGKLNVPFPKERRLHLLYFREAGKPGEKLHIADPRPWLDDQYFVMREDGTPREISAERFYDDAPGTVHGVGVEGRQNVYMLAKAGGDMKRRTEGGPIYAIVFDPEHFDRSYVKYLAGMPNLEQIQLRDTNIQDEDLIHLQSLPRLKAIGLNNTAITDEGIRHLRKCRRLQVVECHNTQVSDEVLKQSGLRRGGK